MDTLDDDEIDDDVELEVETLKKPTSILLLKNKDKDLGIFFCRV